MTKQHAPHSTNHRCVATIYRHGKEPLNLVGDQTLGPTLGGPVALVGCQTSKTLSGAAGTFTLTVKRGSADVREEIRPGDWVIQHWIRNGKKLFGMMGIVVSVMRDKRVGGGATQESWLVTGQDFGRIFAMTEVWFDDYTAWPENVGGKMLGSRMGYNPTGRPDEMVQRIIDGFLGGDGLVGGAWVWPKGLDDYSNFFVEGLSVVVGDDDGVPIAATPLGNIGAEGKLRGFGADEVSLFQPSPGTMLHGILTDWSNPTLNELYYDLDDRAVLANPERPEMSVFIRERPFINEDDGINSPWFSLPTVTLKPSDMISLRTGSNDDERLNLFMIYSTGTGMSNFDQYVSFAPAFSREECAKYGIRKFERTTKFADFGGRNGGKGWIEEMAKWARLLVNWYSPNHLWLGGTGSTPFIFGEARIGKRLVISEEAHSEEREQYYIEGVSHSWTFPRRPETTLTLTRGFEGSDNDMVRLVKDISSTFQRDTREGVEGFGNASKTGRTSPSAFLQAPEEI